MIENCPAFKFTHDYPIRDSSISGEQFLHTSYARYDFSELLTFIVKYKQLTKPK